MPNLQRSALPDLRDFATHAPLVRKAASLLELTRAAAARARRSNFEALGAVLKAARLAYPILEGSPMDRILGEALRSMPLSLDDLAAFPQTARPVVENGILLKAPHGDERGVLLVTFEDQWLRILRHADLDALADDYHLVLSPTWSPPYDLPMAAAASLWPGERIFTLLSNFADREAFARFSPKLRPVPLLASSWVDPEVFAAGAAAKEFDVVMVANFSPYKRHGALFAVLRALRRIGRKPRVLLAGVPWQGRTADTLRELATAYGVADQIEVRVNLGDEQLRDAIRSARVALIFSLIEGSCVAAAECLMLDVPLGMLATAHIGSKAFVNEQTGRLLRPDPRGAAEDLARFLDDADTFRPRQWMIDNGVTYASSTRVLDDAIREEVQRSGERWTAGIVEHRHVRLRPRYARPEIGERFARLYDEFPARYGIALQVDAG
ncbi:MAG TPA: glycosyltransferase [Myxococcales bacterium]